MTPKLPVIAITGAAGPVGRALLRALLSRMGDRGSRMRPGQLIAIDAEPEAAEGILSRPADISSPEVLDSLTGVDVVIHLAPADDLASVLGQSAQARRLRAVRAAQAVSMAAAAVGARRLIVVTSAMVFGARPENPVPLLEDAARRADPDDGAGPAVPIPGGEHRDRGRD